MKSIPAVQVFAVLAILVGLLVSYSPPPHNAEAIWGLVGTFIGFCMKELFPKDTPPNAEAPVATPGAQL